VDLVPLPGVHDRPTSSVTTASRRWLVSRSFDLTWFFGGAALSLLFLALYFVVGAPIVALWWVWLLAFDGPHIGAAFTRTYFDADEWRRRPGLLLTSLLTFAVGPLFLIANVVTRSDYPFLLFLAFATFYGYYHVVRQHYGFVALYNTVNRDWDPRSAALDRSTLYIGCWAPYAYFLMTHPKARELMRLPAGDPTLLESIVAYALLVIWVVAIARFLIEHIRQDGLHVRNPKTPYLAVTVLLYGFIYFAIARYEPVYGASQGPDQDFLLLSIVIVIFHNLQYVGLVWFHNRNRYIGRQGHGLAGFVNRAPAIFLAACALFSVAVYFTFACSTGVFPSCQWFGDHRSSGPVSWNQIGLCLWWGLAMNHYYLDQKIWRVRGDDALKRSLRLA
jgi:hypothetical protein